jgi:hypothetical protein
VFGLEEAVDYVANYLRIHGPFDGVLCFSQGGIFFRHFYNITQMIDPDRYTVDTPLTYFEKMQGQ